MYNWNFDSSNYSKEDYQKIPAGKYRVRIKNADVKITRNSGLPMIELTLEVNGYKSTTQKAYIVLNPDNPQFTNQQLGRVFDSFRIDPNDKNEQHWIGKDGGAEIFHQTDKEDETKTYVRVRRFLKYEDVILLPAWENDDADGIISDEMVNFNAESNTDTLPF